MMTNGVMLITGGSRGIGAATARLAATRGYAVYAILWLLSADASFTTGSFIDVAGGR